MTDLFSPLNLGPVTLANRIVMAPLTRTRAGPSHVPNDVMLEYYSQRASAGLIFTECSMIDADASAYLGEGGIFNEACAEGWRRITDAVHERGGKIAMQIWHAGRAAHSSINGVQPASSSNKPIRDDYTHTPKGREHFEVPRPIATDEVARYVDSFAAAARRAMKAGFDAVQLHGAHGYLIDQFLRDSVNDRVDRYGGSIENRARFLLEVLDATCSAIGAGRIGVRISPLVGLHDMAESQPAQLVAYLAREFEKRRIGHFEIRHENPSAPAEMELARIARANYSGALLLNGGFDRDSGDRAIREGRADAIAYGTLFISNPDLPRRFRIGAALNEVNFERLYGGGADGYTDYPALPA